MHTMSTHEKVGNAEDILEVINSVRIMDVNAPFRIKSTITLRYSQVLQVS